MALLHKYIEPFGISAAMMEEVIYRLTKQYEDAVTFCTLHAPVIHLYMDIIGDEQLLQNVIELLEHGLSEPLEPSPIKVTDWFWQVELAGIMVSVSLQLNCLEFLLRQKGLTTLYPHAFEIFDLLSEQGFLQLIDELEHISPLAGQNASGSSS